MFYLTTHSTHFIYGYMASDIWLRTILIVREETRCRHIGYSFRLAARVLLYAPSHRQDSTYHGLCYTSRGALAGTRNSSMGPPHEGSIRRPIAPWYIHWRLRHAHHETKDRLSGLESLGRAEYWWGGGELFTRPYPLKAQACPLWDQNPAVWSNRFVNSSNGSFICTIQQTR